MLSRMPCRWYVVVVAAIAMLFVLLLLRLRINTVLYSSSFANLSMFFLKKIYLSTYVEQHVEGGGHEGDHWQFVQHLSPVLEGAVEEGRTQAQQEQEPGAQADPVIVLGENGQLSI